MSPRAEKSGRGRVMSGMLRSGEVERECVLDDWGKKGDGYQWRTPHNVEHLCEKKASMCSGNFHRYHVSLV